ncbi:hypothetical protein NSQ54_01440 [Alkalihalobacillus sp. FSL W8-0930]
MYRTCSHCNRDVPMWKIILSNWRSVKCTHCKKRNYTTTSTQRLQNYFLLPLAALSGIITGIVVDSLVEVLLYVSLFVCVYLLISLPFYRLE